MKIGFIGTGVMGKAIVKNLMKAGHELTVYNRTKAKTDELVAAGATWADSPQAVAKVSQVVFSMVGFPADVRQIYFGETGLLAGSQPGTVLVDLTTSEPALAAEIAEQGQAQGLGILDAPVSGGDIGGKKCHFNHYGRWCS
ncbi:hypothetical protein LPAF129_14620 [Ligilactobacillus pabuli]|uniref:6-phosphogluconate dehydrogenase NADP-binding domain-containing protein n=1 Tax=Ligilactobacillus pabuli TaxID=2886039 RepID=A0ABQ5JMN9_9LACO|nr:hypothetical protein LPAF129_14620 [Ligilactobacillus pabuli]